MKKMKNLLSLVLALVMVMAMTLTAMATSSGVEVSGPEVKKTITINKTEEGHTYEAYQIFTGTLTRENGENGADVLTNIDWGSGVDGAGILDDMKADESFVGMLPEKASAKDVAELLGTITKKDAELTKKFAEIVSKNLKKESTDEVKTYYESVEIKDAEGKTSKYEIQNVPVGYYFVKDQDGSLKGDTNDTYTRYILDVVGDTEVTPKGEKPSVEKKVKDTNDSTGVESGWQDSADYDINDTISYQLAGKLPENYADYKQYYLNFVDTLSKGLTFSETDLKVYVATKNEETGYEEVKELTKGTDYSVTVTPNTDTGVTVVNVTVEDLKYSDTTYTDVEFTKDCYVIVEYTATLNENAKIGAEGNPNTVTLEYSNNPNQEAGGTPDKGTTPPDKVIVFTFDTTVFKVDADMKPLDGAEFTLEKLVKGDDPSTLDVTETEYWKSITKVGSTAGNVFTFSGLDDGYYRLKETKTPPGYNSIDDIYFAIEATHDEDIAEPALKELQVKKLTAKKVEGVDVYEVGEAFDGDADGITFNANITPDRDGKPETIEDNYTIDTNIKNQKGVTLPETGGIGTTIFTVSGIILVIIAGVLLVTKKRMSKEQ